MYTPIVIYTQRMWVWEIRPEQQDLLRLAEQLVQNMSRKPSCGCYRFAFTPFLGVECVDSQAQAIQPKNWFVRIPFSTVRWMQFCLCNPPHPFFAYDFFVQHVLWCAKVKASKLGVHAYVSRKADRRFIAHLGKCKTILRWPPLVKELFLRDIYK